MLPPGAGGFATGLPDSPTNFSDEPEVNPPHYFIGEKSAERM